MEWSPNGMSNSNLGKGKSLGNLRRDALGWTAKVFFIKGN